MKLISPGNVWQPGIPLVDSIEKGREGNQEGSDQHKGEEGVISVNHLNISPDDGQAALPGTFSEKNAKNSALEQACRILPGTFNGKTFK